MSESIPIKDGIIKTDSNFAKKLGFTSDKFSGWLWKDGEFVWISLIVSLNPGKGNTKELFDTIERMGFKIIVPTPSNRMRMICEKRGMEPCSTTCNNEYIEIMIKK